MYINLMSFNIQSGLDYLSGADWNTRRRDLALMARAIKQCGADIVVLNEVRGAVGNGPGSQPELIGEMLGMNYYFAPAITFPNGEPYGNAILSRFPILSAENIPVPDPPVKDEEVYYETRCLLKVRLDVPKGLTILGIHFGLARGEAKNAVAAVLDNLEDERCVLMGDFNLRPEDELLVSIRQRLVDAAGMFDGEKLSFPSDKPEEKIDYIFVTDDLKLLRADIPEVVASDHRPHTAMVEL